MVHVPPASDGPSAACMAAPAARSQQLTCELTPRAECVRAPLALPGHLGRLNLAALMSEHTQTQSATDAPHGAARIQPQRSHQLGKCNAHRSSRSAFEGRQSSQAARQQ